MEKLIFSQNYINDEVTMELFFKIDENFPDDNGYLYYGFPTVKILDHPVDCPSIFIISEKHGVIMIFYDDMVSNRDMNYDIYNDKVDRIDTFIYSQMIKQSSLRLNLRSLKFEVTAIKYLPNIECVQEPDSSNRLFYSKRSIIDFISSVDSPIEKKLMGDILATLDASTATIKPKERKIAHDDNVTKAFVLNKIESQIAKFDQKQRFAATSMLFGPQRIRGLAGSGKTIILCLKAAYLHLNYPDKKIVYTFYTKSLYDYVRQLITRFYMSISDGLVPDYENGNIQILHAWGGANVNGLYHTACSTNSINSIRFMDAKREARGGDAFAYVCNEFIKQTKGSPSKLYDFILIDEAQDFDSSFYQLCRSIVKEDHLIWGYDELQNIFNVSIQDTLTTFKNDFNDEGINLNTSNASHQLISNDIVLPKSYRNIKQILIAAISYGFGIYNEILVQSLENNSHWEDLGFKVLMGNCERVEDVIIERPTENSPLEIPATYQQNDYIEFISADDFDEEVVKVGEMIIEAINEDKMRPDDIMVISLDDRYAKRYMLSLANYLEEHNISSNNLTDNYYTKGFAIPNYVTLSTVYKAKGNEAAMVFVMGCDVFNKNSNSRTFRNKIFTAFTRAKIWLRITGIKIANTNLTNEYDMLQENDFKLVFKNKPYHLLNRDWNESSQKLDIETMEKIDEHIKQLGISIDDYIDFKKKNR